MLETISRNLSMYLLVGALAIVGWVLISIGWAAPTSAADSIGDYCGIIGSDSTSHTRVVTGYLVTEENGRQRCYPIPDPAYYVCLAPTISNQIYTYGEGVEYTTSTFTDIYVLVRHTRGDGGPPLQVRLYEKVGTMDGGDVTSFQTDELTDPTIPDLAAYLTAEIGFNFAVDRYAQANAAINGTADITFGNDSSGSQIYRHAAIVRIGPLTNRRDHFSISFYRHVQQVRSTVPVSDPQPTRASVPIRYNGNGDCQPSEDLPEYDVSDGAAPVGQIIETRCSYDCSDDFNNIDHTIMPNGGIITGIPHKEDGTKSTQQERAAAGLAHDCMSSGGTMTSSSSCVKSDPDDEPDTRTCTEVVSESKPGQTAYFCQ